MSALPRLASDIRELERHVRILCQLHSEITGGGIRIVGPGAEGRDYLRSAGAQEALAALIDKYLTALSGLVAEFDAVEAKDAV